MKITDEAVGAARRHCPGVPFLAMRDALEAAASTQPPSPQAEVQDCETCGGEGEGPVPTTVGAEHGERPAKCSDCAGKQPPAEPEQFHLTGEDVETIRELVKARPDETTMTAVRRFTQPPAEPQRDDIQCPVEATPDVGSAEPQAESSKVDATGIQSTSSPNSCPELQGDVVEAVTAWIYGHTMRERKQKDRSAEDWPHNVFPEFRDGWRAKGRDLLAAITPLLYKQWRSSYEVGVRERLASLERLKPAAHADPKAKGYTTIPAADGELLRRSDVLAALDKEKADA